MAIAGWKPLTGFCDATSLVPFDPNSPSTRCDINAFITLIKHGIHDLVLLSTLLAVVILVYAGMLWLTSGGNRGKHDQALGMLGAVVKGYVWILAAWVIVYSITSVLLYDKFNFLITK